MGLSSAGAERPADNPGLFSCLAPGADNCRVSATTCRAGGLDASGRGREPTWLALAAGTGACLSTFHTRPNPFFVTHFEGVRETRTNIVGPSSQPALSCGPGPGDKNQPMAGKSESGAVEPAWLRENRFKWPTIDDRPRERRRLWTDICSRSRPGAGNGFPWA